MDLSAELKSKEVPIAVNYPLITDKDITIPTYSFMVKLHNLTNALLEWLAALLKYFDLSNKCIVPFLKEGALTLKEGKREFVCWVQPMQLVDSVWSYKHLLNVWSHILLN